MFSLEEWLPKFSLDSRGAAKTSFQGPDHFCITELLRREIGFEREILTSHVKRECDVFVLGLGEGRFRSATKVGGLPYFGKEDVWPISKVTGKPLTFICQFNFSESLDLVGKLPGDVLLVFCADMRWFDSIEWHFAWRGLGIKEENLVTREGLPSMEIPVPVCYSERLRYCDYVAPNLEACALEVFNRHLGFRRRLSHASDPIIDRMNTIRSSVFQMCVLKTGGIPYWAQPQQALAENRNSGRFLAQIPPIEGQGVGRWPWLNMEKDNREDFTPKLYWPPEGCIHLFLSDNGEVAGRYASLEPW